MMIASVATRLVLYFVVDDLRPELNQSYGQEKISTPNIDELSARGVVFERAYAQFAVCAPSRNSFMTGRRPDRTQVYNFEDDFREVGPDWITLPQYFKQHGYITLGGGKTFHPGLPANYDEPYSWSQEEPYFSFVDDECNSTISPTLPYNYSISDDICTVTNESALYDYRLASQAIEWMQKYQDNNLFLAIGFRRPHLKYIVPKSYFDLYPEVPQPRQLTYPRDRHPIGWCCSQDHATLNGTEYYTQGPYAPAFNAQFTSELRRGYYASVSFMDSQLGRVVQTAAHRSPIILLHGDHGYELGEQANFRKRTNSELGTRVPLIVLAPEVQQPGIILAPPVELVDVYRTLADLAGLPEPADDVQGTSLANAVRTGILRDQTTAFSQFPRCPPANETKLNILKQGECDHVDRQSISFMGYSIRTLDWRYTVWLRFSGTAGIWTDCDLDQARPDTNFCSRELYDYRGVQLNEFDALDANNVVHQYPLHATELHRRLRAHFEDDTSNTKKHNVLWFIVDDLRPQLGSYGQSQMSTPYIDSLASQGIVFQRAYSQFAVCAPSRNSFMTGRRPRKTMVYNFKDDFREVGPEWITLPQYFKMHNYLTLGGGKTFHPGVPPNYDEPYSWSPDFPYFPLTDDSCNDTVSPVPPYDFGTSDDICTVASESSLFEHRLADTAIDWLDYFMNQSSYPNFFFAVGFYRPHLKWIVPLWAYEHYANMSWTPLAQPSLPRDIHNIAWSDEAAGSITLAGRRYENAGPFSQAFPDDVSNELRKGYYAAVTWMDSQLGRILERIKQVEDNTIIVVSSDHGYQLGKLSPK